MSPRPVTSDSSSENKHWTREEPQSRIFLLLLWSAGALYSSKHIAQFCSGKSPSQSWASFYFGRIVWAPMTSDWTIFLHCKLLKILDVFWAVWPLGRTHYCLDPKFIAKTSSKKEVFRSEKDLENVPDSWNNSSKLAIFHPDALDPISIMTFLKYQNFVKKNSNVN